MSGFGERLNQRQKGFKKIVDSDEARRKREDAAVQLRKQVKEEALLKKRQVNETGPAGVLGPFSTSNSLDNAMGQASSSLKSAGLGTNIMGEVPAIVQEMPDMVQALRRKCPRLGTNVMEEMPEMVQALNSDDNELSVLNVTQKFRKLLSVETSPPIDEVIQAGIVPRFVQLLQATNPILQLEVARVLTIIASGSQDQKKVVVENGALPLFVQLLGSTNEDIQEQAVRAVGNIGGDCPHFRDLVFTSGGDTAIMQLIATTTKTSLIRNATWALSNLCRKKPLPLEWVAQAMPTLAHLLQSTDCEVLADAALAISYLADGENNYIAFVLQAGVVERLVELLGHPAVLVQSAVLRGFGNIATGDELQTQAVLDAGVLRALRGLMSHSKEGIRKECCWLISNVTAGNGAQIQEVVNAQLIPEVVKVLRTDDFDIRKEALWVISNATDCGNAAQVEYLVKCECIKPLCDLLSNSDASRKMQSVALNVLRNMLKVGKIKQLENQHAVNRIATLIDQAGGLQKFKLLKEDINEEVSGMALDILQEYFLSAFWSLIAAFGSFLRKHTSRRLPDRGI